MVRVADLRRGWGKFCSKSCKAKEQESRTGQNAAFQARRHRDPNNYRINQHEWVENGVPMFDNAHQFSNEDHDCNKPWPGE